MIRRLLAWLSIPVLSASAAEYTVLISKSTAGDDVWRKAADTLAAKHGGEVITFEGTPAELKKRLGGKDAPRWICWVARP